MEASPAAEAAEGAEGEDSWWSKIATIREVVCYNMNYII